MHIATLDQKNLAPLEVPVITPLAEKILRLFNDPFLYTPCERYHGVDGMIERHNYAGLYAFLAKKLLLTTPDSTLHITGDQLIPLAANAIGNTTTENFAPIQYCWNKKPIYYPVPACLLITALWYETRELLAIEPHDDPNVIALQHIGACISKTLDPTSYFLHQTLPRHTFRQRNFQEA